MNSKQHEAAVALYVWRNIFESINVWVYAPVQKSRGHHEVLHCAFYKACAQIFEYQHGGFTTQISKTLSHVALAIVESLCSLPAQ